MKSKETEITILFPLGKQVTVGEEVITIKAFKLGELPKVFKVIEPISQSLASAFATKEITQVAFIGRLLSESEPLLDLIAMCTHKPREYVDELDVDQGIELLNAIFEVNADFFIRKVLPVLNKGLEKINQSGRT